MARGAGSARFGCLDPEDLGEPSTVAFLAAERRPKERVRRLERELRTDDARPEHEHVHVVVLDALVRGVRVVADRGANAADLAGRNRGADAGTADEDPSLRRAATYRLAEPLREVRVVVVRIGAVATEVDQLVARRRVAEPPDEL